MESPWRKFKADRAFGAKEHILNERVFETRLCRKIRLYMRARLLPKHSLL